MYIAFQAEFTKNYGHRNDKWAEEVRMRVWNCHDLVASETHYHITIMECIVLNKDEKGSNATTVCGLYVMQSNKILIFFANEFN